MIDFYSIYKDGDERSESLLNECIESGKQHKINVIPQPGVYSDIEKHMQDNELFIHENGQHKVPHNGVIGCFFSHYYLWNKCVELDAPIGVCEYDAVFLNKLSKTIINKFEDYLNLDYNRHLYLKKDTGIYLEKVLENNHKVEVHKFYERFSKARANPDKLKFINNNHIKGAFGYVIKPSGAKKLISATKMYGILPADIQPNLLYCNLYYTVPSVVMLNPTSLIDRARHSHTTHDRTL